MYLIFYSSSPCGDYTNVRVWIQFVRFYIFGQYKMLPLLSHPEVSGRRRPTGVQNVPEWRFVAFRLAVLNLRHQPVKRQLWQWDAGVSSLLQLLVESLTCMHVRQNNDDSWCETAWLIMAIRVTFHVGLQCTSNCQCRSCFFLSFAWDVSAIAAVTEETVNMSLHNCFHTATVDITYCVLRSYISFFLLSFSFGVAHAPFACQC